MANEDRQSEHFIREVDEELRRAQLKAVWDRFAPLIIGVCVVIVAITAGYRGYIWWQERQAAQAGDRFMTALETLDGGNTTEGEATLAAIVQDGAGDYPALAELRIAGAKAATGNRDEALKAYDAVVADTSQPQSLRDVARVRAALLALDSKDFPGAVDRAAPLNVAGNPWRHAAREVIGTAAYASGDLTRARDLFSEIQQDAETPPDVWVRSGLMVSLIDGRLEAPATSTDTSGEQSGGPAASAGEASVSGEQSTGATPEPLANDEQPAVASDPDPGVAVPDVDAEAGTAAPQNAIPPQ